MAEGCIKCKSQTRSEQKAPVSLLSSVLVVLIPKCPLCVMAYSSALTVCGGEDVYMSSNNWLSFAPILLSLLIIGLIARRPKGQRTYFALAMAGVAALGIVLVHQLVIPPVYYNVAAALQFLAIWLNGSLISFVSTFMRTKRVQANG